MANLITAQEVIELAFSENSNMREESIPKTTIGVAEIKYIRPVFGAMYALLADKYADFTNEYVKPALAYFVKCEMMSSIAIDMSNSGVAVSNPQYQNAASDKQRQRLYDSEMSKAKTLLDYALSYIAVHSEEFPDYSGPISKKSYRVGGILLGNERVATSIMGEAFKEEYERYLREMQEINEVVVDATEEVSQALIEVNVAIANTEEAVKEANTATANANTATEKTEEATQKAEETISKAEDAIKRANSAAENAEKVGEDIQRVEQKADDNAKEIQNIKENAVKPEDYYPKMSVGFADNLIGRGEATKEEFTYRPTNGKDPIEDEVARVTKIKGNSVVWNQHLNPTFIEYESSIYLNDGGVPKGHKFALMRSVADGEYNDCYYFPSEGIFNYVLGPGEYGKIFTNSYDVDNDYVQVYSTGKSGYVQLIDLTKMFGAGNEPTTIEEFYARIPSGIDITAYNEGEIINLNTEAIKTVGFNQWDEKWELGGFNTTTGINNANTNQIRSKLIQIIPNTSYFIKNTGCYAMFYDSKNNIVDTNIILISSDGTEKQAVKNGNSFWLNNTAFITPKTASFMKFYNPSEYGPTYNNDICINLSHTGWRNGEYEPYREFTRELPVIKKYFPDGMKKAGNVFDSIEWDSSKQKWVAVQRVGTRSYETNDESNEDYLTDLTNTNYPFTAPIVTEIEDEYLNFDYDAEDFGTEEALSSVPSAPFSADIIYKFNAVDSIRQNQINIKTLQTLVESLQSQVASLQATNANVEA